MKRATDVLVVGLAITGCAIIIGSAGNSDCIATYPFIETVKHTLFGMLLCVPAVMRILHE